MIRFSPGDRVIATSFDTPYACDLTGFYGHVTEVRGGFVIVRLEGCTADAPDRDTADHVISTSPWPFFAKELQHAD